MYDFSLCTPWKELSIEVQKILLYGTPKKWTEMVFINPQTGSTWIQPIQWRGFIGEAKKKYHEAKRESFKQKWRSFMHIGRCSSCQGSRLQPYPSAARFREKRISDLVSMPLDELHSFFSQIKLSKVEAFAQELVDQTRTRIGFLIELGLGYLTLDRPSTTLSGGEFQRVRLATHIGSPLVDITYVLDEPSIGLHPVDNKRLIQSLQTLCEKGNTVVVVEHDLDMMRAADYILDFGPGAGKDGGQLLYEGKVDQFKGVKKSLTSDYLFGRKSIGARTRRVSTQTLTITDANHHNLKNVTCTIPLGLFVAITGLSGSGKSSLILETLYPALSNRLMGSDLAGGQFSDIQGVEHLQKILHIDQSPIGKTPRSNPATYTGLYNEIRNVYANLSESKARGWQARRFSFNVQEGACCHCSGVGSVRLDMDFFDEVWIECPECQGKRFNNETLQVMYKGLSIADTLQLTCKEALAVFSSFPKIKKTLSFLCRIGLDYLQLGQPSPSLSGGEAQRLKITRELAKPNSGNTLYILDEPTTGLHVHNLAQLLDILHELVDRGNSVIVIEHNIDAIRSADWVIDIGPNSGPRGGEIIAQGTPETISAGNTPTGIALRETETTSTSKVKISNSSSLIVNEFSIPKNQLIAITGPSGSGKRQLAFQTIFAEGQRRYVESLSPYVRQFVKQYQKAEIEKISGISPTIGLKHDTLSLTARSTVGTMTEIYDRMRVLWAAIGMPFCPKTGLPIKKISIQSTVKRILSWSGSVKIYSPIHVRTTLENVCSTLSQKGFVHALLNEQEIDLSEPPPRPPVGEKIALYVLVDRVRIQKVEPRRISSSVEEASRLGEGQFLLIHNDTHYPYNLNFGVEESGESYPEITAKTFSFNTPEGQCPDCQGLGCHSCFDTRLRDLARSVTIEGQSIYEIASLPIHEARKWFQQLPKHKERAIQKLVGEIIEHLNLCERVGLKHLSLARCSTTLSLGEALRARLVPLLKPELSGLIYVLDGPTIGLHPIEVKDFTTLLLEQVKKKNTVLVIDHNPLLLKNCGHHVELSLNNVADQEHTPKLSDSNNRILLKNASCRTLENFSCSFPTESLVGIVGKSGSGKSTLLFDVLEPALTAHFRLQLSSTHLDGLENISRYVVITTGDQAHSARSDIASFVDFSTPLRSLYASLDDSGNSKPAHFSPYHYQGMCPHCRGLGYRCVEMYFLPTVDQLCEHCSGLRLKSESLKIEYGGKNFGELLKLSVREVGDRFSHIPKIARLKQAFEDLHLDHLLLGDEMTSLSPGIRQRIRLATELARAKKSKTLYLIEEPGKDQDPSEVSSLIKTFHHLRNQGDTILIIDHNPKIIESCDYLIELDLTRSDNKTFILGSGTPIELAKNPESLFGPFLYKE